MNRSFFRRKSAVLPIRGSVITWLAFEKILSSGTDGPLFHSD
jgi:hypothetical protein